MSDKEAKFLSKQATSGSVFQDGDTVCFLGDSISHVGLFHRFIYDYYLTRFPQHAIRFVNAGVAGDWAGGTRERLTEDVIAKKPTVVTLMFGMNDVNRACYVSEPDPQQKAAQQEALDHYRQNMETLVGRLRNEAGNPHLIFMTPSPFDQTAINNNDNNQPGCNDGLSTCATFVRKLAENYKGTLVDFHAPMTALNQKFQKENPNYSIIGPDRVHPGAAGHLMMTWLFLKAQRAPALVSKIVLAAAHGKIVESLNATVSNMTIKDGGLEFKVQEKALPFPVNSSSMEMLAHLPIEQELNQEIMVVTELKKGQYDVLIDGTFVGQYSAETLSKGINLAFNPTTPQFQQAQNVAKLNEDRHSNEVALRDLAAARWFLRQSQVNPDDLAAVRTFSKTIMNKTGYFEEKITYYLEAWTQRELYIAKIAELEKRLSIIRQPMAHLYTLRLAQSR